LTLLAIVAAVPVRSQHFSQGVRSVIAFLSHKANGERAELSKRYFGEF